MPTIVDGVASSVAIDTAGEIVDLKGLDISSLVGAPANWEHESKLPSQIIGKIIEAHKIFSEEDCQNDRHKYFWNKAKIPFLYCKVRLFDDERNKKPSAVEVASLFKDDAAHPEEQPIVGFSIEGSKLNKSGAVVTHSIARKLTITCIPANKTCIAELVPQEERILINPFSMKEKDFFKSETKIPTSKNETNENIKESKQKAGKKIPTSKNETNEGLKKALDAGSMMAAPSALSGGSALGKESLDKKIKKSSDKPFHGYNPEKHSKEGGLKDSYREKYNKEHGSHLKRPVTGKVKPGSKAAKRRKSFCARMSGVPGPTSKDGKLTPKGAALKRWKCSENEESSLQKKDRCWEGYEPTPGKKPYEKGSCKPMKKSDWSKKADDAYQSWMEKNDFKKYMKKRMPHLADGEVDAIGRILALKKEMQKDESLSKMYASYFRKNEYNSHDIETLEKGFKENLLRNVAAGAASLLMASATPAHAVSGHLHQYIDGLKQKLEKVPGIKINSQFKPLAGKSLNGVGAYTINVGPYTIRGDHRSLGPENTHHELTMTAPKDESKEDPQSRVNAKYIFNHLNKVSPKLLEMGSNVEIKKFENNFVNLEKAINDQKSEIPNPDEKTEAIGEKTVKGFVNPKDHYVKLAIKHGIPKHWQVNDYSELKNFHPNNPSKIFNNSGQQHLIENQDHTHKLHPLLAGDILTTDEENPLFPKTEENLDSLLSNENSHPLDIKYFYDIHPRSAGAVGKRAREAKISMAKNPNGKLVTPHMLHNLLADDVGSRKGDLEHKFELARAISSNKNANPETLTNIVQNSFRAIGKRHGGTIPHEILKNIINNPSAPENLKNIINQEMQNNPQAPGLQLLAAGSKDQDDLKYNYKWTKAHNLDEEGNPIPPPLPAKFKKPAPSLNPVFTPEESRIGKNENLEKTTDIMMAAEEKDGDVCLPEEEFKKEHERLIDVLGHPTVEKLKAEKKKQEKEVKKKEILEKGAKGDWEKEGYKISHHQDKNNISITAHDKDGNYAGDVQFNSFNPINEKEKHTHLNPISINVDEPHQRKGLGNAMYSLAEKITGLKVNQSNRQTEAGKAFWEQPNRPFGKSEIKKKENFEVLMKAPNVRDVFSYVQTPYHPKEEGNYVKTKIHKPTGNRIHIVHSKGKDGEHKRSIYYMTDNGKHTGNVISRIEIDHNLPSDTGIPSRITHAKTEEGHRGKNLNPLLYISALKDFGEIESDTMLSPGSQKTYEKLSKHPNVEVEFGQTDDPNSSHILRWKPKFKKSEKIVFESLEKSEKKLETIYGENIQPHQKQFIKWAKTLPNSNWQEWAVKNHAKNPEQFDKETVKNIEHFAGSKHIPNISKVRFDNHDIKQGLEKFKTAENEYNAKALANPQLIKPSEKTTKFMDVGDDYAWYALNKPGCEVEGKAMGHCGNVPTQKEGQNILSLRKKITIGDKEHHQPVATFILNPDGKTIGEMKGRANLNPQPKYHKYIKQLFEKSNLLPEGGGHLEGNNFHLDDLSHEDNDDLLAKRPDLVKYSNRINLEQQKELAKDSKNHKILSKNPNLHKDVQMYLIKKSTDPEIREEIARNSKDSEIQHKLLESKDREILLSLASNSNIHSEIQHKLLESKDPEIHKWLAKNCTHPEIQEKLFDMHNLVKPIKNENANSEVHQFLAKNTNISKELQEKLFDMHDPIKNKEANPSVHLAQAMYSENPEIQEKLFNTYNPNIHQFLASSKNPKIQEKLLDMHDPIKNKEANPSIYNFLAKYSENPEIQKKAQHNLLESKSQIMLEWLAKESAYPEIQKKALEKLKESNPKIDEEEIKNELKLKKLQAESDKNIAARKLKVKDYFEKQKA